MQDFRHPAEGFVLPVPTEWQQVVDAQPGIPLVAIEPERGPWFRANAVLTIEPLDPTLGLDAWQDRALQMLPQVLDEFLLVDLEDIELGGQPARRTLAHYAAQAGAVTAELWATVHESRGYTLTTSVGTLEYDDLVDTFTAMAHGLRP